jgi:hypothetical protein
MRIALGILFMLHGIAHLVGFVVPWRIGTIEGATYTTRILSGRVDLGDAGIRAFGVLWLALAVGFAAAALGTWAAKSWWVPAAAVLSCVSLAASVLGWPDARIGVPVNLAILIILLLGTRLTWF